MFDLNVDLVDLVSTSRWIGGSGLDGGFLSLFGQDEIDALANVDQVAAAEADHQNVAVDVVAPSNSELPDESGVKLFQRHTQLLVLMLRKVLRFCLHRESPMLHIWCTNDVTHQSDQIIMSCFASLVYR